VASHDGGRQHEFSPGRIAGDGPVTRHTLPPCRNVSVDDLAVQGGDNPNSKSEPGRLTGSLLFPRSQNSGAQTPILQQKLPAIDKSSRACM
jgi:hypothetical protein